MDSAVLQWLNCPSDDSFITSLIWCLSSRSVMATSDVSSASMIQSLTGMVGMSVRSMIISGGMWCLCSINRNTKVGTFFSQWRVTGTWQTQLSLGSGLLTIISLSSYIHISYIDIIYTNNYLIANCEHVTFVMMFNNNPRMPSWQCYNCETVGGFRQATNQNAELHNGDTVQESLLWTMIFQVDYWQICSIWTLLKVVHDWIRISKPMCDSAFCLWCKLQEIIGVGVFWRCDLSKY